MSGSPTRTLVVWLPDWPLTAARVPPAEPAVVVAANRVIAASPAARDQQVTVGLRRREAQGRCAHLIVVDHDPSLDARRFEPLVAALEPITPRIEIIEPGWCSFPTRGPSRYFGGDAAVADLVIDAVDAALAGQAPAVAGTAAACQVGIADGPFPAELAARSPGASRACVVEPGASRAFLEPLSVASLDHRGGRFAAGDQLVDLLWRLGLRTLGDVAALPGVDLAARFGPEGLAAHRLASGLDGQAPDTHPPPPEWSVQTELDPPIDRVDTAMFWAKSLADELYERLTDEGASATRILIEAETEHGESLARSWRHEGTLGPGDLAARVRWQLDGWLSSTQRPTAGISLLRLVPTEVVAEQGRQLGFWGGESQSGRRAARAVARVQALVGVDGVTVPELRGGRGPVDQVGRVTAAAVDVAAPDRAVATPDRDGLPWPGRLPAPSPAIVRDRGPAVDVLTAGGTVVEVTDRGALTSPPALIRTAAGDRDRRSIERAVTSWAGPWPTDERWWDPTHHRRRVRLQVVLDDGVAHLVTGEADRWYLEATYD